MRTLAGVVLAATVVVAGCSSADGDAVDGAVTIVETPTSSTTTVASTTSVAESTTTMPLSSTTTSPPVATTAPVVTPDAGWTATAISIEYVRRALSGESVADMVATDQAEDFDGQISYVPFDPQSTIDEAAALAPLGGRRVETSEFSPGRTPEGSQGDDGDFDPGCGLVGDVTFVCNVEWAQTGGDPFVFQVVMAGRNTRWPSAIASYGIVGVESFGG